MDNLFPPGRGTFGGGSLAPPATWQQPAAHHSDMGGQCSRCPMDRCIVPAGTGGHAMRLLHAQPELDLLQPASLPILATLRAGFWRCRGTVRAFSKLLTAPDSYSFGGPNDCSFPPAVNRLFIVIVHILGAMKSGRDSTITSPSCSKSITCILLAPPVVCTAVGAGLISGLRGGLLTRRYLFQISRGPEYFCPPAR